MENESLKVQTEKVIEQLTRVKEEFIKDKEELAVSIRKDAVKIELKDILENNNDYASLRDALNAYIKNLFELGRK